MTEDLYGVVINLNAFGATVRLADGELASAPLPDVEANRATYERAQSTRTALRFVRREGSKHATVLLVPEISSAHLDEQIAAYLKSTESHHFLQRVRRRSPIGQSKHPRA